MTTEIEEKNDGSISCSSRESELEEKYDATFSFIANEWRKCISAYNQFHQVYIHGQMSSCDMEKKRLFAYMRWRASTGEKREKAVKELWDSFEEERNNMTNPNVPWTLREDPAAHWRNFKKQ